MSKDSVSEILGIPPYDVKFVSQISSKLIYKYRTTDRNTIPFFMNKTNGVKTNKGKWVNLFITYDEKDRVIDIESCSNCEETKAKEKKIDFNAIVTFVTLTLPSFLFYLGLKP
ncbi:MAG: hypothetical protein HYU68_04110 [Bacteroidetes bacterium]|nr:hypothetical protein [Bacteroidota bacterium]